MYLMLFLLMTATQYIFKCQNVNFPLIMPLLCLSFILQILEMLCLEMLSFEFFFSVYFTLFSNLYLSYQKERPSFQFRPIRAKKQLKLTNNIHEKGLIRLALTLYDQDLFATQARILSVTA